MKVCKVVVNSVSQDARVLKQAAAIREAGFDVVIIGIQDANNSVPIQVLDNGVVIRRAAWQSSAYRPPLWLYAGTFAAIVAFVMVVAGLLYWLKGNFDWIGSLATFENAIAGAAAVAILYFSAIVWRDYRTRRRSFNNLRKREEEDSLKYDVALSAHLRRVQQLQQDLPQMHGFQYGSVIPQSLRALWASFNGLKYVPRPLMGGLVNAFLPANVRRWRAVFARERTIHEILLEERPDIVHAHDLSALPVAEKYARRQGSKLIFDAHEIYDHLAQSEDEMSELNAKMLRKYSGDIDLFVTINDSIARYYRHTYSLLPRAVVVKNAARLARPFTYDGRLHEAAGLPRDVRILIYQGGFAPKRGLIQLLLSAEHLNSGWSLVFMGWGRLEEELHRVADSLKMKNPELDPRIRFVPKVKQDELPFWTAGASLGAIPYENTGLNHWYCNPNKLWEYPNAGVPAIASPFPEMRGIIEAHQIGWLLPDPLSPREIAAVVNRITDEELETASRNCLDFIRKDNWDVYAERLKAAYAGIK